MNILSAAMTAAGCAALAPVYMGVPLKVRAWFQGRRGPSIFFPWSTIVKLTRKDSVYSGTTTALFRIGPVASAAAALMAFLFFPLAGRPPVLSFTGDVIVVAYAFAAARFFVILAALDTGSSFEGMGASREAFFSIMAEAGLFMAFAALWRLEGATSMATMFGPESGALWDRAGAPLSMILVALFLILLTENARSPVDDPATHLELTMIHEVMILDHGGPDLALIQMGAAMKLFFHASMIASLAVPMPVEAPALAAANWLLGAGLVFALVGVAESIMARYKMTVTPKFILTSFALAFGAALISLEMGL